MKRMLVGVSAAGVAALAVLVPWNTPVLPSAPTADAATVADDPLQSSVSETIAPWCSGVPVTLRPGTGGQAGYTSTRSPLTGRETYEEYVEVGRDLDAGHPATRSVALHECAHILQYRAYGYDYTTLETDMDRVYPDGTAPGIEHMADCISDELGAVRDGRDGAGAQYTAGYGGTCSEAQREASRRIIAGERA